MVRPTISACIGVYNGASYLKRAIESVRAQTIPVDEIVVVDDGSSDGSAEIAEAFDGVRVLRQANGGIGAARRALVEAAQSDWIAFCDHDDWWEPNRLEMQVAYTAEPDVVLIYAGVWHVDENGIENEFAFRNQPEWPSIDHVVPNPEDIWTSSTLLRREAVIRAGNFNPNFRAAEDMLMWFGLASIGRIVQVPQRLVHMTRRRDSTSAPTRRQFEYAVALYEDEVLPNFDKWFASTSATKRAECRKKVETKLGYTMSLLATFHHAEGNRKKALELLKEASRLAPGSRGVWYRYVRSLIGLPAKRPS